MTEKAELLPSSVHHPLLFSLTPSLLRFWPDSLAPPPLPPPLLANSVLSCPSCLGHAPLCLTYPLPGLCLPPSVPPPHPRSLPLSSRQQLSCRWMTVHILSCLIPHQHTHTHTHTHTHVQNQPPIPVSVISHPHFSKAFKSAPLSAWLPPGTPWMALICNSGTSEIPFRGLLRATHTCTQRRDE